MTSPLTVALDRADPDALAAALDGAPDADWAHAHQRGAAPDDWASTDRDAYAFLPARRGAPEPCPRCDGLGHVAPEVMAAYFDAAEARDMCPRCFAYTRVGLPTPALWIARGLVTYDQWHRLYHGAPFVGRYRRPEQARAFTVRDALDLCATLTTHELGDGHAPAYVSAPTYGGVHTVYIDRDTGYLEPNPDARGWRLPTLTEWCAFGLNDALALDDLRTFAMTWHTNPTRNGITTARRDPHASPPAPSLSACSVSPHSDAAVRLVRAAPMP